MNSDIHTYENLSYFFFGFLWEGGGRGWGGVGGGEGVGGGDSIWTTPSSKPDKNENTLQSFRTNFHLDLP